MCALALQYSLRFHKLANDVPKYLLFTLLNEMLKKGKMQVVNQQATFSLLLKDAPKKN